MNQLVVSEQPRSVLVDMSRRYGMEPAAFEATVRATCMRPDRNGKVPSREEFAAFLLVAKEYGLNPLTKEIYAFTAKGGGIVPIVSVDGWVNLVNSNKHCDGFEFDMDHDGDGKLVSCTCRMYRKDRSHPVTITEYLSECIRGTEPWAMKHRMLRHKAMIQAARYAFGFAGIYDEDEGRTIAEAVDVTPRPRIPSPSEAEDHGSDKYRPGDVVDVNGTAADVPPAELVKEDPISSGLPPKKSTAPDINADYDGWFSWCLDKVRHAEDGGWLETFWNDEVEPHIVAKVIFPSDSADLADAYGRQQQKLQAED